NPGWLGELAQPIAHEPIFRLGKRWHDGRRERIWPEWFREDRLEVAKHIERVLAVICPAAALTNPTERQLGRDEVQHRSTKVQGARTRLFDPPLAHRTVVTKNVCRERLIAATHKGKGIIE